MVVGMVESVVGSRLSQGLVVMPSGSHRLEARDGGSILDRQPSTEPGPRGFGASADHLQEHDEHDGEDRGDGDGGDDGPDEHLRSGDLRCLRGGDHASTGRGSILDAGERGGGRITCDLRSRERSLRPTLCSLDRLVFRLFGDQLLSLLVEARLKLISPLVISLGASDVDPVAQVLHVAGFALEDQPGVEIPGLLLERHHGRLRGLGAIPDERELGIERLESRSEEQDQGFAGCRDDGFLGDLRIAVREPNLHDTAVGHAGGFQPRLDVARGYPHGSGGALGDTIRGEGGLEITDGLRHRRDQR